MSEQALQLILKKIYTKSIFVCGFIATFFVSAFASALPAFASGNIIEVFTVNSPVYKSLDIALDVLSIILLLIAVFYIFKSIHNYGRSTIGIAILYFLNATIVLGAIRLVFVLGDDGIITMQDITGITVWHIFLVYSAIVFFFSGKILLSLVNVTTKKASYAKAMFFMAFSFVFCTAVILSLHFLDNIFSKQSQYSWIESYGIYNIIGVVVTAFIAVYLYQVKKRYKGFDRLIGSMHVAIGLITTICLWEQINETWNLLGVSENFVEFMERVLWIPVFIYIILSFRRLLRLTATAVPAIKSKEEVSTNSDYGAKGESLSIDNKVMIINSTKKYVVT